MPGSLPGGGGGMGGFGIDLYMNPLCLNTMMQRTSNENAAGLRMIWERSDHPNIERTENK